MSDRPVSTRGVIDTFAHARPSDLGGNPLAPHPFNRWHKQGRPDPSFGDAIREKGITQGVTVRLEDGSVAVVSSVTATYQVKLCGRKGTFSPKVLTVVRSK
jgi:hypothetical protein